jgi:predicted nucleic-acid-binding protein
MGERVPGRRVRITADTNVLLRMLVDDDRAQADRAEDLLDRAEEVVITLPTLCEVAWVLRSAYKYDRTMLAQAIRDLIYQRNVRCSRPTIEFGLDALDAGGDFSDAVMAYDGAWYGGETFATFDERAIATLTRLGHPALAP